MVNNITQVFCLIVGVAGHWLAVLILIVRHIDKNCDKEDCPP